MTIANQFAPIWNSSGVNFSAIRANVTDIASSGTSTLLDLRVNDSGVFSVNKAGDIATSGNFVSRMPTLTTNNPAINLAQTWNNAGLNFSLIDGSITPTAASASYWFNFTSTSNWGAGSAPFFRASARDGAIEISSMWGQGSLLLGSHAIRLEGQYGNGFLVKDYAGTDIVQISTEYQDAGIQAQRAAMPIGWSDLKLRRDAANTLALQRSTNAQTFRLYGTYTDASNYRRLYISSTTAGAFTLGVEGAGTGASGNTLNIVGNTGIGTSSPNVALVIRRSGADLPALRLEDGDITVPFTGIGINPALNANTVGSWSSSASASGGMSFSGFTNNTAASYPLIFEGYTGSASPTKSIISFSGWKTNGGTGATTLASSELLAGFFNGDITGTPVVSIAANGAITASTGTFSGHLSAVTKSFLIDHPTKPGRKLQYGSLESPYHGIRLTGRTFVEGGIGVIELPDYVRAFVSDDVNIQLTPIGRNIIWVDYVDLDNNQVIVGGDLDGDFYWSFTGIRNDVELEVEPWA